MMSNAWLTAQNVPTFRKDSEQTKQIEELQKQNEELADEKERLLEEIERIIADTGKMWKLGCIFIPLAV